MASIPEPPPLSPELADIFARARKDVGDPEQVARIGSRLGPTLDAPVLPRPFWKPALLGSTAAAATAAAIVWIATQPSPHQTDRARTAPPAVTAPALAEPEAPVALAPSASAVPEAPPPVASAPAPRASQAAIVLKSDAGTPADTIVLEHALLGEARRSLASDPGHTLDLVLQHQQRFPRGSLGIEREFLRISALARLGRMGEARAARDRFVAVWPNSPYRDAIDRLTGATDTR